jgi:hypothetical protein
MMKHYKKMLIVLVMLVAVINVSFANSWTRHIYNKTSAPWVVDLQNSKYGNVYTRCSDKPDRTYKNAAFVVAPHATCSMKMTTTDSRHSSIISIHRSAYPMSKKNRYCYGRGDDLGGTPTISHSGSTGGISVNRPSSGDINLNDASKAAVGGDIDNTGFGPNCIGMH